MRWLGFLQMVPEPQPENGSKMGLGSKDNGEVAGAPPTGREKAQMVVTDATEGKMIVLKVFVGFISPHDILVISSDGYSYARH